MTEPARHVPNRPTLIFRCDANPAIGTGHVMRCLALAQAWQATGGNALFAVAELPAALQTRLLASGFGVIFTKGRGGTLLDAAATVELVKDADATWIVVDGDRFGPEYLQAICDSGLRLLLVDDFASRESFPAHLLLNPNLGASQDAYLQKVCHARLLLGTAYIPLRREFVSPDLKRAFPDRARCVLVTLGGSDPENLTPRIAEALCTIDDLHVIAVAGASHEHWSDLERLVAPKVSVVTNASNMPELMHSSDLAIAAGGGTLWELLHCGCAVLSYSRNPVQGRVVDLVAKRGAARDLGDTKNFSAGAVVQAVKELAGDRLSRQSMTLAGRLLIDGEGAQRVIAVIYSMS